MINKIKKGFQIFALTWKILRKKQKILFFVIFLSILIKALLETIGVSVLIPFVQAILNPEKLMNNKLLIPIISFLKISDTSSIIIFISLFVIIFYIIKNFYSLLCTYWQQKYRCYVQQDISVSILKEYLKQPYSFFIKNNSSILIRNIINDADGMMSCINAIFNFFTELFIVLMITVFLFITDPFISLGLVISMLIVLLIPTLILGKPIRKTGGLLREYAASVLKNALQTINGIKEIIVSNKQNYFSEQYQDSYNRKTKNDIKSCVLVAIPARLIETVCISSLVGIVSIKIIRGNTSEIMVAQLSAFAAAAFKLIPAISGVANNLNSLIASFPVLTSVYTNLRQSTNPTLLFENSDSFSFDHSIRFENVSFHYENSEKYIFKDVNITINKGDVVGIIGPSGAGKTTFVDVLLGLLQNTSGSIYIDNQKLSNQNVLKWRKKLSYVPQTAYILDDTIESNIAFGIEKNQINKANIKRVLEDSMLKDYVLSLSNKELTKVGERGIQMSGGQRQRLSIARALYTNPDVIVFDEATSALDETTEKEIMESIDNLIGSKTIIIIAHRLSTLKKCNKIFEVKNSEVLEKNELYDN